MELHVNKSSILPLIKNNNLMQLLSVISKTSGNASNELTPSKFIEEMTLTTEERYKKLTFPTRKKLTVEKDVYPLHFVPSPNVLIFQSWRPGEMYELTLQVRNSCMVLMPLKMVCERSSFFTVKFADLPALKVAPGLSIEYQIIFTPKEKKDYSHYIKFETDGDVFYVPILAIGPRALLDIPDEIYFPPAPVKIPSEKLLVIRNIGDAPAVFNFINEGCFKVVPKKGYLGVQEVMQLSIYFEAPVSGEYSSKLSIFLETGEKLIVALHGTSENVCVRLDKNSILLDETFIGLRSCKTVKLINNSPNIISFGWMKNKSIKEDLEMIENLKDKYDEMKDFELIRDAKLNYFNVSNRKKHELSCERILEDEIKLLKKEEFRFWHEAFIITPEKGELWPKSFIEFSVSFEPKTNQLISTEAFLEVSGREARLPLKIQGNGKGPAIVLNIGTLDIDFLYLCCPHSYEVIAVNQGDIPGTIGFQPKPLVFGGKVESSPKYIYLEPGQHGVFVITYSSNRQGDFTENLDFLIVESKDIVTIILKGKIISPTLHFDKNAIDFGTIPVGFPTVEQVTLSNLSMVPVTYSLKILTDGSRDNISYTEFAAYTVKPALPKDPKEFIIYPSEGVVDPYSSEKVKIVLTPNSARRWGTQLVVDIWDSSCPVSCPIKFHSYIAQIFVEPNLISIPFCFVNFPYTRTVTLKNKSKVPGFFYIVPQDPKLLSPITYSPNISQGVLEPKGTFKIALSIICSNLGKQTVPLNVLILGNEFPNEMSSICCVGQGPVVTLSPSHLDWGEVHLLHEKPKDVLVVNECPIPASCTCVLKANSPWAITPTNFTLKPEERLYLNITLYLRDRGKYNDLLKIEILNGKTLTASLSGVGVGSNLIIEPKICPKYDLGTLFSNKKCNFDIKVKNGGTKPIGLIWSPFAELRTFANMKFVNPSDLVFKLEPTKMDLQGGEEKIVQLAVQSSEMGARSHTFYCFATIGSPMKELHLTTEILAEFVEPLISLDKKELSFWYNSGYEGIEEKLEETVTMTNQSVLNIAVHLEVADPFYIEEDSGELIQKKEINFTGNESQDLLIKFKAEEQEDKNCRVYKGALECTFKEHFKKTSILLLAELNYPNVSILPKDTDFDCIPICTQAFREITLVNTTPLPIYYHISWDSKLSSLEYLEKKESSIYESKSIRNSVEKEEFEGTIEEDTEKELRVVDSEALESEAVLSLNENFQSELQPPTKPIAKFPEIEIKPDDIREALFPDSRCYYSCDDELLNAYQLTKSSGVEIECSSTPDFVKFCDITPFHGKLEKFESQVLAVRFGSDFPVSLHAVAHMTLNNGPTETIRIDAKAANISYYIDRIYVDFGRQLFCETGSQTIKIFNTGLLPFDFETNTMDPMADDEKVEYPVECGILIITPRSGHVLSHSEVKLLIKYHPGTPGIFEENFQLRIGFLNPITIQVTGFGVFPQVHVDLPRPGLLSTPVETGYAAIASLTADWFLIDEELSKPETKSFIMKAYRSEETNISNFISKIDVEDFGKDWVFIENEPVPSDIDIQLSCERILAYNLITSGVLYPSDFAASARIIPNFVVPEYEIDFGTVIVDKTAVKLVSIWNYGPLAAVVYFTPDKQSKDDGIRVRIKTRNDLKIGGNLIFSVYFLPRRQRYKKRVEVINTYINFEVFHGARIPIHIIGVATYPFVEPSMDAIDFKDVKCGTCKIIVLQLKNSGLVPADWYLDVKISNKDIPCLLTDGVLSGCSTFSIDCDSGTLQVNECKNVQVTFKPLHGGIFASYLYIKVTGSMENLKIKLIGEAIEPALAISDLLLSFDPVLPNSKLEKSFTIKNPCPFPVEFCVANYDDTIYEEEKILQVLFEYYGTDELLLPLRSPGALLPPEITDFYRMMVEKFNAKELEEKFSKASKESGVCDCEQDNKKALKSKRSSTRPRTVEAGQKKSNLDYVQSIGTIHEEKTPMTQEEKLHKFVKELGKTEPRYNPIQASFSTLYPSSSDKEVNESSEGTLIIFHGAPYTSSAENGNRGGLYLKLPVLSIDRIVLEEAAFGRCEAGLTAKNLIERAYYDYIEPEPIIDLRGGEFESIEGEEPPIDFYEKLEELERKLNSLINLRKELQASRVKSASTRDSPRKEKVATKKSMNTNAPIANITEDLVFEILKFRLQLEVEMGVVIESLESLWINSRLNALMFLLKAAGNIKDILMIVLLYNYEQYQQRIAEEKAEEERRKILMKEEILRIIEEEPELLDNLSLDGVELEELILEYLSKRWESQNKFCKVRDERFEILRQRREARKKGLPVPPFPWSFREGLIAQSLEMERQKLKSASSKIGKMTSAKKTGTDNKSTTQKVKTRDPIETEFSQFEQELKDLKNILEKWDRSLGNVVNDPTELKSRKGTSSKKLIDDHADTKSKSSRGVHLWLLNYTDPEKKFFHSICQLLKSLLNNRDLIRDSKICAKTPLEPLTFSVVTKRPIRDKIPLLNMFTLCSIENAPAVAHSNEELHESKIEIADAEFHSVKLTDSQGSVKTKKRSSTAVKMKRRPETRMSVDAGSVRAKKPNLPLLEECPFKPRWILQPQESMTWRLQYHPTEPGKSEQHYLFEIPFWHKNYNVKCVGICDIPAIDMTPEVMFDNVAEAKPSNLVYPPTFFLSNNTYDFGTVIPSETRTKFKSSIFKLKNKSKLLVDLTITFVESGNQTFSFEPDSAFLKPEESTNLTVHANPQKYGPLDEEVMLIVKDNPKIEKIRVKCHGVKVNLNITPTIVDFGKLLLYRKGKRSVLLTNMNCIPLYVALYGHENFPQQFSFSPEKGVVQPSETLAIDVNYEATEVQSISEQMVEIKVYDNPSGLDPLHSVSFLVSVEAYDALLDISFATPEEHHVDFGDTRVDTLNRKELNLKNVGEYLLGYKIEFNYDLLAENGGEDFYVTPVEGKLIPGKAFPLVVEYLAKNEVAWKRLPLFRIRVCEPARNDELIASIPIEVSMRSYFSNFVIQPLPDYNLGPIKIGSQKSVSLIIQNKGKFSLTYNIQQKSWLNPLREIFETDLVSKKSSKKTAEPSVKEKGKKTVSDILKLETFEISPSTKIVEAGETAVVQIICSPTEVKTVEEIITIFVDECPPDLRNGSDLKITAEGCLPKVNFEDFKVMFREHYVYGDESDFVCPPEIGCYSLFTIKNMRLSFKNVCVGKTMEARIHLENIGQIDCHVIGIIEMKTEDKGSRSSTKAEMNNFSVAPSELIIEPYTSSFFTVIFRPDFMETFKGRLTMTLEMPPSYEPVVCAIELNGSGCIPQVDIMEPPVMSSEGQALVTFPPTTPGFSASRKISFKNTGKIACKVILEIYKPEDGVFTLNPFPDTETMLNIWELSKPIEHTAVVSIAPDQQANFNVEFRPAEVKSYACDLKLFVIDNPFENLSFKLLGEVYFEEVVIEKIQTETQNSEENKQIAPGHYNLNLGYCFVKKKKKAILRLANRTEHDYFKFEWDDLPSITISPSYGHLYPKSYKEIVLTFSPLENMDLSEVPFYCHLLKINYPGEPMEFSWDSRLISNWKLPRREPATSRTISRIGSALRKETKSQALSLRESLQSQEFEKLEVLIKEPEYEVSPDPVNPLTIQITCIADYARLSCQTTNINFEDTFMFQNRTFPLILENTGNVPLDFFVELINFKSGTEQVHRSIQTDLKSNLSLNRPKSSQYSITEDTKVVRKKCGKKPRPLTCESLLNLDPNSKNKNLSSFNICEYEEVNSAPYNPIKLSPLSGKIFPRESATCHVTFSPLEVNEYKSTIKIKVPNLHPDYPVPEIPLTARSLMPYCHFDVPESDYLSSGRRDYSRPGPIGCAAGLPLDSSTKAIEIKVLGIGITIPIAFHAINPTDEDYTYSWINVTQSEPGAVSPFHCNTLDGNIQSGRRQLMQFDFLSQSSGNVESFWKFCIPKYDIEALFLFVGSVREPCVYFLSKHTIMTPTLVGATTIGTLKLLNHENVPFEYYFIPDSLYSEGRLNYLSVEPSSGTIAVNTETMIRISFTGKQSGKTLFNLKCKVEKFKEPLMATVEVLTHSIQPLITFVDLKNLKHTVNPLAENLIDFGTELNPGHPETITLVLTNTAKTSFYYEWLYNKKAFLQRCCKIKFSSIEGHVTSQSRATCDLSLVFSKKSSIKDFPLKLKISRGSTFHFLLTASATTPHFQFSFLEYNFGYCFLQQKEICFYEVPLIFKNKDSVKLVLECSSPQTSAFTYELPNEPIPPGGEISIPIRFSPRELKSYTDELKFTVNGIYEKIVTLSGEGTIFKVTLLNAEDKMLSLGAVREGKKSSRQFSLINKSLAPAIILIGFSDQLPIDGHYLAKIEENAVDLSKDYRLSNVLKITPSKPFVIKSQEIRKIEVQYTPKKRAPLFSETICMQFQEKSEPLAILSGCCIGAEFFLDRDYISFGAVVASCSNTLKLKIINSGDIGGRFEWRTDVLENDYSISPSNGYCSAGSEVTISVTFQPKEIKPCIRKLVECKINLSQNEKYQSLFLKICGDCIDLPKPLEIVKFECHVRDTVNKSIEIFNRSGNEWQLIPVITGEFFKGIETVIVPCMSSVQYEITYQPLTMTEKDEIHQGSIFFRLPDGQGLLYELTGTSLPPLPQETIVREVPCKTKYTELLKIKNWLQYPQRLKVSITCVSNENSDATFTCNGFENVDLPALNEKEYYLNFFSYKTGKLNFNVSFVNEETKEYVWYDITFNMVMCGPLEVITLKAGVRQPCTYELKLENPLEDFIEYKLESTSHDIHFTETVYKVPPNSSVYAELTFLPIHPGEKTEKLKANCKELGLFPWDLNLIALKRQPESLKSFEAHLGSSQTQDIEIRNISRFFATFKCKTDCDEFHAVDHVNVASGQVGIVSVTYKPNSMECARGTLFIESEQAGYFEFPLIGTSLKPLPKGPFIIRPGSNINIPFKNVLKEAKTFQMYVDNPAFTLKNTQEDIQPKSDCKINVGLKKTKQVETLNVNADKGLEPRFPVMGQLVIQCFNPHIKWQFYLKGILEKGSLLNVPTS